MANSKKSSEFVKVGNAEISHISVTINAIKVKKKQMTLAVFRQLEVVSFIDDDGYIDEDIAIWGVVRYTTDGCANWIVGSEDGQLLRYGIDLSHDFNQLGINREKLNWLYKLSSRMEEWINQVLHSKNDFHGPRCFRVLNAADSIDIELTKDALLNAEDQSKYLSAGRHSFADNIRSANNNIQYYQQRIESARQLLQSQQLFIAI